EAYAPFGGVFKFFDESEVFLDRICFRREDIGPSDDMKDDLRGYVPGGKLHLLASWFAGGQGRETGPECMRRELDEELREANLRLKLPQRIQFKRVRVVEEGPEQVH